MKSPYTPEELSELIPKLEGKLTKLEDEYPNARPLPPLPEDRCREMLLNLLNAAHDRALTLEECFLFGQLLCSFRMAVMATTLGYRGNYFVISEDQIKAIVEMSKK